MAFQKVTHDLHRRRKSRNIGLGLVLGGLAAIVFGLAYVKVTYGTGIEGFDHAPRSSLTEQAQ